MLRKNVALVNYLFQEVFLLRVLFTGHVLYENSDLQMKSQKQDKNALLTKKNERQVLFAL